MSCARGDLAKGSPRSGACSVRRSDCPRRGACSPACRRGPRTTLEWPCIQRKVLTLTAAQMWDGPEVERADRLAGGRGDGPPDPGGS